MPYKMNPPQYESVLALSGRERASHFIAKVADWRQLWGVRNEEGWLVPVTPEGLEYFPLWPHPEYAQNITDIHFPGHIATEISLDELLSHWLPLFESDSVKVAVFPNDEWALWIMEATDLAEGIKEELAQYE